MNHLSEQVRAALVTAADVGLPATIRAEMSMEIDRELVAGMEPDAELS